MEFGKIDETSVWERTLTQEEWDIIDPDFLIRSQFTSKENNNG